MRTDHSIEPRKHGGGNLTNLTPGDLLLIVTLKKDRPTTSLKFIHESLSEFGEANGTSAQTSSRAVKGHMLSGLEYSRKKVSNVAKERFTVENMAFTGMFIDYVHFKDPYKLKCFDECGLKLPHHGKRLHGHAPYRRKVY